MFAYLAILVQLVPEIRGTSNTRIQIYAII